MEQLRQMTICETFEKSLHYIYSYQYPSVPALLLKQYNLIKYELTINNITELHITELPMVKRIFPTVGY